MKTTATTPATPSTYTADYINADTKSHTSAHRGHTLSRRGEHGNQTVTLTTVLRTLVSTPTVTEITLSNIEKHRWGKVERKEYKETVPVPYT